LIDASENSSGHDLRRELIDNFNLPSAYVDAGESILDELCGWLMKLCLELSRESRPISIVGQNARNELHAALESRKRKARKETAELSIPVSSEDIKKHSGAMFVSQIEWVAGSRSTIEKAISHFIRANCERLSLFQKGNITESDWIEFERAIESKWENFFSLHCDTCSLQGQDEKITGSQILSECTGKYRKEELAGEEIRESYLIFGSHHRLANQLRIGWHPRFKEIAEQQEQDNENQLI